MSLRIAYKADQKGFKIRLPIPVQYNGMGMRDFNLTKTYVTKCLRQADIAKYGLYDSSTGYNLALSGYNDLVRFMYFYEGDDYHESELRTTPSKESEAGVIEWLREMTFNLGLKDETELDKEGEEIVLKFKTRSANVKIYFQIIEDLKPEIEAQAKMAKSTPPRA